MVKLDGTFAGRKRPETAIRTTVPFTRIPADMLGGDWTPLLWGRWRLQDHITLGEGRAVIRLLDLIASNRRCHRHKVLSLQDNRPISGSVAKGRSSAPTLNRLCRQKCAISLAAEIKLMLPWLQSAAMPADELSRRMDFDLSSPLGHTAAPRKQQTHPYG